MPILTNIDYEKLARGLGFDDRKTPHLIEPDSHDMDLAAAAILAPSQASASKDAIHIQ
jgi:hypothetical protein